MIRHTFQRVKVTLVRERAAEPYTIARQLVKHGGDAANLLRTVIGSNPREVITAIYLDVRCRIIGLHEVSTGTIDQAIVHPRDIFGPALTLSASALILAHNHPSGDATPSGQDKAVTERIKQCGEMLGVAMLDHIVVGESRYYSFADECFFPYACTPRATA